MHGMTSDHGLCSAVMVVGELVAGVCAPGDRGRVERAEADDQKGDDDEDAHGAAPFDVLTRFYGLIGYWS